METSLARVRRSVSRSQIGALVVACAIGLLLTAGCGSNGAETADVEGTITLDGDPLENATVEFQPTGEGSPSYGTTDASGHYELMFTADQSGAMLGEHEVRISTEAETEDELGNVTVTEEVVPEKYNLDTELKVTVEPGGSPYDFDLATDGADASS